MEDVDKKDLEDLDFTTSTASMSMHDGSMLHVLDNIQSENAVKTLEEPAKQDDNDLNRPAVSSTPPLFMCMPLPAPEIDPVSEVPGAHAVGPSNSTRDLPPRTSHPCVVRDPLPVAPTETVPLDISHRGLAEARVVEEVQQDEIGQARPVSDPRAGNVEEADQLRQRNKQRAVRLVAAAVCYLLLSAVVVIVVVTVATSTADANTTYANRTDANRTDSNSSDPSDPPNHNNQSTPIPVAPFLSSLPNYTVQVLQEENGWNSINITHGTSPQVAAYKWMLQDPSLNAYSIERQLQRYALAVLYYATNGPNWRRQEQPTSSNLTQSNTHNSSHSHRDLQFDSDGPRPYLFYRKGFPFHGCRRRYMQSSAPTGYHNDPFGPLGCRFGLGSPWLQYHTHECEWFNQHDPAVHDTCNDHQVYTNLYLSYNDLRGTLPKELALLTGMQRFFVINNYLRGTIPEELFYNDGWTQIKDFWIRNNFFNGTLPAQVGLWKDSLERLNANGNAFTGTIPTELYNNMPRLKMAAVVDNQLTGRLDLSSVQQDGLTSVRLVGLLGNGLTGTLPTEWGPWSTLFALTLENNQFQGSIPSELGLLTELEYLALGKNDLESSLPSELGQMTAMTVVFSVMNNPKLTGAIPTELGSLPIEHVFLQGTGLSGTIPNLWCNASKTTLKFDCSDILCGCGNRCPCSG